jgi:hypothetical protein
MRYAKISYLPTRKTTRKFLGKSVFTDNMNN